MYDPSPFDYDDAGDALIGPRRARWRRRRGCYSFIVTTALFVMAAIWLVAHRRQVEVAVFVACVGAAGYLARRPVLDGIKSGLFKSVKTLDATAVPVPLASVQPGKTIHTAGLVGLGAAPLHPPFGAPPCAWYRVFVEPAGQPGAHLFSSRSADDLVLEDGMGAQLTVRIDGARWLVQRRHEIASSPEDPNPQLLSFLAERGIADPACALRAYVEWIGPRELVFVRGLVREAPQASDDYRANAAVRAVELVATEKGSVLIALEPLGARAAPAS
ncbi:MAG TPA: hypothetical protein VLM85_00025 [Polyangiaceae bacterium]|nr:hypothetical protein [Polyangiaceae bacterium]